MTGGTACRRVLLSAVCLLAAITAWPPTAGCQPQTTASAAAPGIEARPESLAKVLDGEWVGARLLCRKEEDSAVRCGKPVSFSVTFKKDGTGSSNDEHFPNNFTYRWKSSSEVALDSGTGGDELTLFQFEFKEGFLTFQTYIYLAGKDQAVTKKSNYIHYIFDVHRIERP